MDGSGEEEELCPLCLEPLDETDRRVLSYCGGSKCSFLPCLFCHQRLLVENQACPNCRQPYDQDKVLVEQARYVIRWAAAVVATESWPHSPFLLSPKGWR